MEIKNVHPSLSSQESYHIDKVDQILKRGIMIKIILASTPTQNYLNPTWVDETLKKEMKINLEKSK
jgi:hypothetical protein